jgi:hypothetical protein
MISRQQLQLINRRKLGYPLDIAEKDYHLALAIKLISESMLMDHPEVSLDDAVDILRQKEIRASVSPQGIAVNWQRARAEASDEMRSIYFAKPVSDDEIATMISRFTFTPLLPSAS